MRMRSLKLIKPLDNNGEPVQVAPGIRASFRIAGHILGSSLVLLELEQRGRKAGNCVSSSRVTWAITISRSFAILFRHRRVTTFWLNPLTAIAYTILKIPKSLWRESLTMPHNARRPYSFPHLPSAAHRRSFT